MKIKLKPIKLHAQGNNVSLLHQVLTTFGLTVSKNEMSKSIAGDDTLEKVRRMQEVLKVVQFDNAFVVDETTSRAISKSLVDRGLTSASHSFKVSGKVQLANGGITKRQQLIAYDLDLLGVSQFRTVKNLKEIGKNGGFEFLGETVTDNQGNYNITFYDWQYRRAERKMADVVVYAIDKENIVAHSRMVNTEDFVNGFVRGIDLVLSDKDRGIEYESLMKSLNAFLRVSNTNLESIAASRDQLSFTANELDLELSHINLAAQAALIRKKNGKLNHELLYGIGRQNISLEWTALFKKQAEEISNAIAKSVEERIIKKFNKREITEFIKIIQDTAAKFMLDDENTESVNTLNVMLSHALPEKKQRLSFLNAYNSFKGSNISDFWKTHLPAQAEFIDKPGLISGLLLTQQLTALTGNFQTLVGALQVKEGIKSAEELIDLDKEKWMEILSESGIPDTIDGDNIQEKNERYAESLQNLVNAAFPTQRIERMVDSRELSIEKNIVSQSIQSFLKENRKFDFAGSNIDDFSREIDAVAPENTDEVKNELKKIQRVFQISTSPDAMATLLKNGLQSAYAIATIPYKNFIKTYGKELGSKAIARAVHQRASHINTRAEMNAMNLLQFGGNTATPAKAMSAEDFNKVASTLKNKVHNYEALFGSPDMCECQHCRSVFSPAAYFVDLLQFLDKSIQEDQELTPYNILVGKTEESGTVKKIGRRPDLAHLSLSCENTNTLIPYIDLANEVMEFYVAHNALDDFSGHNTGDATEGELRANPQHVNIGAYKKLTEAKFPFSLPFHQPLDVIRTYSDHLKVSRYEVMNAMHSQPDEAQQRAIEAEALGFSQEEYALLTGESFNSVVDTTELHEHYGFDNSGDMEALSQVTEFMKRTGISYSQLIELVKTRFINPHQGTLDFLENIFSTTTIDGITIYEWLKNAEAGTSNSPANNEKIDAALLEYNTAEGKNLTQVELTQWAIVHFNDFQQVITLFEPGSKCNLDTTRLRTIQSIYENPDTSTTNDLGEETITLGDSGIINDSNILSKIHRFIRLWRKLGWNIHETDLILSALGEDDISTETISMLESVSLLKKATKRPLNQLVVLWGNIDTYGSKSLYKKLFLNKAALKIDEAFVADDQGNFFQGQTETLGAHQSTLLAAFRLSEKELHAIINTAKVQETDEADPAIKSLRSLNIETDVLNLQYLSIIYRHVVLAKAMKIPVIDLCKIIVLFDVSPFSVWDIKDEKFINISPKETYAFYQLATSVKTSKFKPDVLEYIVNGNLPTETKIGLEKNRIFQSAKTIRSAYTIIEQEHPLMPNEVLTVELLSAKLSLTSQSDIVKRFMEIIEDTVQFEVQTAENLSFTIPEDLDKKFSYSKGKGLFAGVGVMTDKDRDDLEAANSTNIVFKAAINGLYAAPETFIKDHFTDVFDDLAEANSILLNHPVQNTLTSIEGKLKYVYDQFLPLLIAQLKNEVLVQHLADLIGLSAEATLLLLKEKDGDVEALVTVLSSQGFSADYFNGKDLESPAVISRVDSSIEFSWSDGSPNLVIAADDFSARWTTFLAPPTSGDYTLVVDVEEADEAFRLYLDGQLILEKADGDNALSFEKFVELSATKSYHIILEYVESTGNAGIRLSWKTATTTLEIIPPSVTYPELNEFVTIVNIYHRAALFIFGFKMNETELSHFINFSGDFGNIDFKELKLIHWTQINEYISLRNSIPQAQALLTDVFALANLSNSPSAELLIEKLHLATDWDKLNLEYLFAHFNLNFENFKNEKVLLQLNTVMGIVEKTGLSAKTITTWAKVETDFDELNSTAQLLKYAVKSKYNDEDWLNITAKLNDSIREHQQQALISYLLVQPSILSANVEDADGLFEYFLIDVQMGSCMDTSRIVQASAAIQLFVNRCLLNLEEGVSPSDIDGDSWEWMKNYRVWEANRKIFLYPENWLEPEWRYDKSEFFQELESHLVQNDITERSVEQGLRNYLMSLNEVANLEMCGMHQEDDEETGEFKFLHVFGRTHNMPYKYFYRRWNEHHKWSAWENVQVDIRSVEDGDKSGVHLIPVVWKGRLFLFWPEFMEKANPSLENKTTFGQYEETKPSELEPDKYWEIRLAWSEYVDDSWSPKQVTNEYVVTNDDGISVTFLQKDPRPAKPKLNELVIIPNPLPLPPIDPEPEDPDPEIHEDLRPFQVLINPIIDDNQNLIINMSFRSAVNIGFITSDIQFAVQTYSNSFRLNYPSNYVNDFTKHKGLELVLGDQDNPYLKSPTTHKLLLEDTQLKLDNSFKAPFFFSDDYGTYFIQPTRSSIVSDIRTPLTSYNNIMALTNVDTSNNSGGNGGIFASVGLTNNNIAFGNIKTSYFSNKTSAKLRIQTFYHPISSQYVTNFNLGGTPRLMKSDTEIISDNGLGFETYYDPNFEQNLVWKTSTSSPRTDYKENICFDVYGANSLYNWELFFHAPLYIATRLSKNGKYKEAMKWFHYIFDPTTDEDTDPENETARYWKVLPFKTQPEESLREWLKDLAKESDEDSTETRLINEWRANPFNSHLVASNRPVAYMKHVVVKYVENLIDWGDYLFRQFTRENVYEAMQLYVIANHILGPRPDFIPKRGEIKAETYNSLKGKLDGFSNALVELENIFPYSSTVSSESTSSGTNLLGIGQALYFCIPANDKLIHYWDTVADRLFKIRHCRDIDGIERSLALFAPAIDPGLLMQANKQGLSLGDILANLSSPAPIYRFAYLLQKANEFCGDVKALGSALLSALEKRDAEELSLLRASQETNMIELVTAVRERQVLAAKMNKENLLKVRETAKFRLEHYNESLLGNESVKVPEVQGVEANLNANSQLPIDTNIPLLETDVDESLVDSDETGVKLIGREKEDIDKSEESKWWLTGANAGESLAGILNLFPRVDVNGQPLGVGISVGFGGQNLGAATSAIAKAAQIYGQFLSLEGNQASKMASYIRREQDWTLQANLAAREIIQIDKQITSADIQIQISEKELQNHKQQIENTKEIELYLKDKFTNQELYQWMKEQLTAVYKQSYNLAYEMAKKAEKAYQYELGIETTNFIQYGYWDNSMEGLLSGEKLQLGLRQLDKSFLEDNRRELELSKNISMVLNNPLALIELRETGKCFLSLPEEIFDMDFPGHYFRRIKAVSLSIPCIAGPYTSINCSLRLVKNTMRINTSVSEGYKHLQEDGFIIDDPRFRANNVPVTSIATSSGQNDAGMFEFNFRDERYLPFERAGAISEWQIELSTDKELRQFDYSTISDVILHLKYTARESGGQFKDNAVAYIKDFIKNKVDLADQPLMRMFSMKNEFPSEWHKFLHPDNLADGNIIDFKLTANQFPYRDSGHKLKIKTITLISKGANGNTINPVVTLNGTSIPEVPGFGNLHHTSKDKDVDFDIDFAVDNLWEIKIDNLTMDELEDMYLILGYEWD